MSAINNIILNTEEEALENILSPFIKEQFPSFMREDYRKLVLFIKSYYEWLEQQGNAGFVLSKLDTVWDADSNAEEFYSHFKNTFLASFPDLLATNSDGNKPNKKTLLKKIRDFYGNKGTESAYKFLFRVLYDSDLEIYYPKNDILKVSDGQWIEPKSIKTTSINGNNLFNGKNGQIYQYQGETLVASAFIDSVVQYSFNGSPITEFFITDINGTFVPDQVVRIVKDSDEWEETAYSVLGGFFIELPGRNYRVGDVVTVTDSRGVGFSAKIDQTGLAGSIKKIGIANSGINYSADLTVSIFSESGQQTARVLALRSAVTNYPGYFSGNRGKVSSNKKIQDGHYYQEFSYELKSDVSLDTYFNILKSIIHPSGMKMFGSILVKKSLDNTVSSSSQATYFEVPLIGRYTPYTVGTTYDLRNNGVTAAGSWAGDTGDLYPIGYNPYIGSTLQVGPDGSTTSLGSTFTYNAGLGYTWCAVPEGGKTSHNPIGAPLGGRTAWALGYDSSLSPQGMRGLVLWLKPENIGVCGSVVNGASADVWLDSSPQANHALPPTWDRWNGAFTTTNTSITTGGGWTKHLYDSTNAVTKIRFTLNGLCGGFTTGRLMAVGFDRNPAASTSISGIDYGFYSYGPHDNTTANLNRARRVLWLTNFSGTQNNADLLNAGALDSTNFAAYDNYVFELEYEEPNIVWRINDSVVRREFCGYGQTFYFDSSFYTLAYTGHIGHSFTVLGMWNGKNPVTPTSSTLVTNTPAEIYTQVYAGVTVDKLRPTIQTSGFAGVTGVSFDGGLVFAPGSSFAGTSLAAGISMGFTAAGSTAEKLMTGRHMYLKRPLKITDDADIFVVYKSTLEGMSHGYGVLASRNDNHPTSSTRFDTVLYHRSYNVQDRTPSMQNSVYYSVIPNGTLMYPGASLMPAGLVGFRPQGGQEGTVQDTIAYDPHVSGVCLGICIGEVRRDSQNRIESFLNGDPALNRSRSTGRKIVSVSAPQTDQYAITKNMVFHFDAGKSTSLGEYVIAKTANLLDPHPFRETPMNFIAPQTTAMWRRDISTGTVLPDSVVLVTQDGGAALGTDEVYEFTTGDNGNIYLSRGTHPAAWVDTTTTSTTWTFTATIRRDDGGVISSANVYIYTADSNDQAAGTITDLGGGWYKVTRTKTGTASTVTLVGLSLFPTAGVKYRIGRAQLLPYGAGSDISGAATRTSASYPSGYTVVGTHTANEIGYRAGPWGKNQVVWHGRNHSTNATTAAFNPNVGFYSPSVSVDRTKLYRYSVWINRVALGSGNVYFGNGSAVLKRSDGASDTNPYFTSDGIASSAYNGKENQWVLVVGHIYPEGSGSGSNHPNSGFYLPNSGTTYAGLDASYGDKIWTSTSTTDGLRVFLYGSNTQNSEVRFLEPRIEVVDGSEISVEDLTSNGVNTLYDLSSSGAVCEAFNRTQYSTDKGGAIVFDGGPGVVTTKTPLTFGNNRNITWEAWIKPSFTAADLSYLMFMGGGGLPYFSNYQSRILWSVSVNGVQKVISTQPGVMISDSWHHIVCVSEYDGTQTTFKIYKNGLVVASTSFEGKEYITDTSTVSDNGSANFTIGNRSSGTRWAQDGSDYAFRGSVSNARVYSRALSETEILQNYNSLRSRFSL